MPPDRRAGWTRTSGRAASACSLLKRVGGSSVLRSRWGFRLRCGSPTFGRSRDLFVLPTHRRLGLGRALLASVRAAAIASGALRLVVQTEDDNDPALRLYADSGYALIKGYCSLILPLGPEPR
jgi:GNAT superfamily N-acetyltransferase